MGIVFLWLYCYAKHKMQLTVTDIVWPTKMAELIEVLFGLGLDQGTSWGLGSPRGSVSFSGTSPNPL